MLRVSGVVAEIAGLFQFLVRSVLRTIALLSKRSRERALEPAGAAVQRAVLAVHTGQTDRVVVTGRMGAVRSGLLRMASLLAGFLLFRLRFASHTGFAVRTVVQAARLVQTLRIVQTSLRQFQTNSHVQDLRRVCYLFTINKTV